MSGGESGKTYRLINTYDRESASPHFGIRLIKVTGFDPICDGQTTGSDLAADELTVKTRHMAGFRVRH